MTQIGLFYGSSTDNTAFVADSIQASLDDVDMDLSEMFEISSVDVSDLANYDNLIIGCPTWNIGELQDDWAEAYEQLDDVDLAGKMIALFGVGDQYGYPENFCDAIGILGEKFRERGAELVAFTDIDASYDFEESRGVENGKWMGLAVDEDNQNDLTDERISAWVPQVLKAFELEAVPA